MLLRLLAFVVKPQDNRDVGLVFLLAQDFEAVRAIVVVIQSQEGSATPKLAIARRFRRRIERAFDLAG